MAAIPPFSFSESELLAISQNPDLSKAEKRKQVFAYLETALAAVREKIKYEDALCVVYMNEERKIQGLLAGLKNGLSPLKEEEGE